MGREAVSTHAEMRSIVKLRAAENARRVTDLTRVFAVKIRSAQTGVDQARRTYELILKEDVPALIKARQDVLSAAVRRQVLIECWEEVTGQVWVSGVKDGF